MSWAGDFCFVNGSGLLAKFLFRARRTANWLSLSLSLLLAFSGAGGIFISAVAAAILRAVAVFATAVTVFALGTFVFGTGFGRAFSFNFDAFGFLTRWLS